MKWRFALDREKMAHQKTKAELDWARNSAKIMDTNRVAVLKQRDACQIRIVELESKILELEELLKAKEKRVLVLKTAIKHHRSEIWGQMEVAYQEDEVLYKILGEDDGV